MSRRLNPRSHQSAWTAPLPYSIWKKFEPYRAKDPIGRDGYFLTPDQVHWVMAEIMDNRNSEAAEVSHAELTTSLLSLQGLQSEQERAEALLKKFRISRSGSSSASSYQSHE